MNKALTIDLLLLPLLLLPLLCVSGEAKQLNRTAECFFQCLHSSLDVSDVYYPDGPLYLPLLLFSVQNHRFALPSNPRPLAIVAPRTEDELQATIACAYKNHQQFRVRSGGHDFEGQSFLAPEPFVVIDLFNLRSVSIDVEGATAVVQSGARLGELYYYIDKESKGTLAFPGGDWPSVGVGGQLTGGGHGTLVRKYALGSDNVLDVRFITPQGVVLDRESMNEDLFWAIRGGGSQFGVVFSWTIRLVPVPKKVTVFKIRKTLEQGATKLVLKWQDVAPNFSEDLNLRLSLDPFRANPGANKTVEATFICLFLGQPEALLQEMKQKFPELGVERKDMEEMSFLESCLFFDGLQINQTEILLTREDPANNVKLKQKSDFVQSVIPENGLNGLWKLLLEREPGGGQLIWNPWGGIMNRISPTETPFPHRAGYRFFVYQSATWCLEPDTVGLEWIRKLSDYMGLYVHQDPRAHYALYRDLDLGTTNQSTTPEEASVWGIAFFSRINYNRLVGVKTQVDPDNFFRNQQSIPPNQSRRPTAKNDGINDCNKIMENTCLPEEKIMENACFRN